VYLLNKLIYLLNFDEILNKHICNKSNLRKFMKYLIKLLYLKKKYKKNYLYLYKIYTTLIILKINLLLLFDIYFFQYQKSSKSYNLTNLERKKFIS